jgi:hypothetical protein
LALLAASGLARPTFDAVRLRREMTLDMLDSLHTLFTGCGYIETCCNYNIGLTLMSS